MNCWLGFNLSVDPYMRGRITEPAPLRHIASDYRSVGELFVFAVARTRLYSRAADSRIAPSIAGRNFARSTTSPSASCSGTIALPRLAPHQTARRPQACSMDSDRNVFVLQVSMSSWRASGKFRRPAQPWARWVRADSEDSREPAFCARSRQERGRMTSGSRASTCRGPWLRRALTDKDHRIRLCREAGKLCRANGDRVLFRQRRRRPQPRCIRAC